jgi:hypothetical protein
MEFRNWLETTEDRPVFTSVSNDGIVKVLIRGKMYIYRTDAMFQPNWNNLVLYQPWKAYNLVKRGEWLNPPPKIEPPMQQKSLF